MVIKTIMGKRLWIKKLKFNVGPYNEIKREIVELITRRKSVIVLACSLHDVAIAASYPHAMNYYRKVDMCTTDGMFLVWFVMIRTWHNVERVYGADLMKSLLVDTQGDRFTHVFCGSSPDRLKLLIDKIKIIAPNARVAGSFTPKIELQETKEERVCLQQIIAHKPSVLWLGISSPKQVALAARWKKYFPQTTIICVGAAFDLVSGALPSAPAWMQRAGFEWLFRLLIEPRRLYKRYLFIIPTFLAHELVESVKVWKARFHYRLLH